MVVGLGRLLIIKVIVVSIGGFFVFWENVCLVSV